MSFIICYSLGEAETDHEANTKTEGHCFYLIFNLKFNFYSSARSGTL